MGRFLLFLFGALLGAVAGGGLIFYLYVGAPRAATKPAGEPIKAPDATAPGGTAVVVLNQDFFNTVLTAIFRDINAPAFQLGQNTAIENRIGEIQSFGLQAAGGDCKSEIALKPEGSGVVTGVRFAGAQINAPLAFAGSTSVFGQCLNFTGWADANLELRYDAAQGTVFGQAVIQSVNLDGISPLVSPFVTPLVQSSLNQRVNPIQILRGDQIALSLPIQAANGTLNARVKDVRSEVKDNALHLHLTYDFTGARAN